MARKRDTASRRGADEILEEIVDHLRPWQSHKSVAAITAAVNHELEVLLKLAPLQTKLFDRARNRAHAKKLARRGGDAAGVSSGRAGVGHRTRISRTC
jgi:hypothetical protein